MFAIGGSSQKENINAGNTVPKILELYVVSDVVIDTQKGNTSGPQEIQFQKVWNCICVRCADIQVTPQEIQFQKILELCLLAIGGSSQKENINAGNTVPKILELYVVSDVVIDTQKGNTSGPQEIQFQKVWNCICVRCAGIQVTPQEIQFQKILELCLLAIGGSSQKKKQNINSGNTVPKILELYFASDVVIDMQKGNTSGAQEIQFQKVWNYICVRCADIQVTPQEIQLQKILELCLLAIGGSSQKKKQNINSGNTVPKILDLYFASDVVIDMQKGNTSGAQEIQFQKVWNYICVRCEDIQVTPQEIQFQQKSETIFICVSDEGMFNKNNTSGLRKYSSKKYGTMFACNWWIFTKRKHQLRKYSSKNFGTVFCFRCIYRYSTKQ